jgi:hypothetical protein
MPEIDIPKEDSKIDVTEDAAANEFPVLGRS